MCVGGSWELLVRLLVLIVGVGLVGRAVVCVQRRFGSGGVYLHA